MEIDGDPLFNLFQAACGSAGETTEPAKTNVGGRNHDNSSSAERLRITSENQWRIFANSLASEGFVVELAEQQQLQKLWDRAAVGATSFGRTGKPSLSIDDVYRCVDEMYRDDASTGIENKIANAHESAKDLQALLNAWNMESFNHTQTRQALKVIHRLEMSRRKGVEGLRKEQDRQKEDFITESVLRLIQGSDAPDGDRHESSGVGCSASADERGSGENRLSGGACNPLVWQAGNAGLVDKKVAKLRVQSISYPGTLNASRKHSATHGYGGTQDDPWGVSQGLAGREAISCRRGLANRPSSKEELPVTVVAMPKVETGYSAREKLWRAFLAHRQLALGSCVMRSFGVADRDPSETLFYFEYVRARPASVLLSRRRLHEGELLFRHWARGALSCVAQLSEQSSFTLERRISTANLMIGEQGCVLRLGGIRWGPEIHGVGQATTTALRQRDADLCLGLAETLEGLLGIGRSKDDDETGAEGKIPADSKELGSNARDKMSLMLVNVLSWLRLPAGSREGITLKGLLGHQYLAPLPHKDIESEIPSAWKTFMDQGKEV